MGHRCKICIFSQSQNWHFFYVVLSIVYNFKFDKVLKLAFLMNKGQ